MIFRRTDGVLVRELYAEPDGTVSSRLHQPSRDAILERTARVRAEKPLRDLTFGRKVLDIPVIDRFVLHFTHPELDDPDTATRTRAWHRFIASSDSAPYRV